MRVQRAIVWELATKELRLFFGSPLAYLVIGAFLGLTLFTFFWVEAFFARNISDVRPMFEGPVCGRCFSKGFAADVSGTGVRPIFQCVVCGRYFSE